MYIGKGKRSFYASLGLGSKYHPVLPLTLSKLYWSVVISQMTYGLELMHLDTNTEQAHESVHISISLVAEWGFRAWVGFRVHTTFYCWLWLVGPYLSQIRLMTPCHHWAIFFIGKNSKWPPQKSNIFNNSANIWHKDLISEANPTFS